MGKNKTESTSRKSPGTQITLARKAKRVLQSNGLHFFREWATKSTSGGVRANSGRNSLKAENPSLYRKLISKGEALDRKMDRPPEPKPEAQATEE